LLSFAKGLLKMFLTCVLFWQCLLNFAPKRKMLSSYGITQRSLNAGNSNFILYFFHVTLLLENVLFIKNQS
ncbi:hypothetical protein T4E_84, partial [Trichinella pseudospiralis]